MIRNIELLRFLAAFSVMAFHVSGHYFYLNHDGWLGPLLKPFQSTGFIGVDVFFVISGFIMWHTTKESHSPKDILPFLLKRGVRIYSGYWPWLFIYTLLMIHYKNITISASDVIGSASLYPIGKALLPVSWTLTYEVMFYLVFGFFMLFPRNIALTLILIWGGAALYINQNYFIGPLIIEFALGALVARYIDQLRKIPISIILLTILVTLLYGLTFYTKSDNFTRAIFFGPFSACLIIIALQLEELSITANDFLVMGGKCSYALYLCHLPILFFVRTFWRQVKAYPDIMFGLVILISLTISYFWYKYAESPIRRYANRLIAKLT